MLGGPHTSVIGFGPIILWKDESIGDASVVG